MFLIDLSMSIFLRVWYTIITPKGTDTSRERNLHAVRFNFELAPFKSNRKNSKKLLTNSATYGIMNMFSKRTKLKIERLLPKVWEKEVYYGYHYEEVRDSVLC